MLNHRTARTHGAHISDSPTTGEDFVDNRADLLTYEYENVY